MTSVQERLQLKRTALDKWSIREHLCLASAVSCSGENWMSVSRTLKTLCSPGAANPNRPDDWFSQKSCAVQYGELLENVETPKRKKRLSESNQLAETPTESILRKLTQERIAELKIVLQQEQDEFSNLRDEILSIQNATASDDDIRQMYTQIELEQQQKVLEQQKYAEWLKKREEKKLELQRQWRPFIAISKANQHQIKQEDSIDFIAISKANQHKQADSIDSGESTGVLKQQQQQGTSPLLTSLLKSPSPAPNNSTPTSTSVGTISNALATAPTITNLLTGGTINTTSASQLAQFNIQSLPLTGPPPKQGFSSNIPETNSTQSEMNPTLSVLLENKKNQEPVQNDPNVHTQNQEQMDIEDDGSDSPSNKDELMEVFQGLMDDNIDLVDILTNNNALIPEILGEDLENVVIKDESQNEANGAEENSNIIDGSKNEAESLLQITFNKTNEIGLSKNKIIEDESVKKTFTKIEIFDCGKEDLKAESENSVQFIESKEDLQDIESKLSNIKHDKTDEQESRDAFDKKCELSDDSADVTFHEIAERIKAETSQESKESSGDVMEIIDPNSIPSVESSDGKKSIDEESQDRDISLKNCQQKTQNSPSKQKTTSESSDVIIIQEDSNEKNLVNENLLVAEEESGNKKNEETAHKNSEDSIKELKHDLIKPSEPTTITILDTDDDSTHFEMQQVSNQEQSKVEESLSDQIELKNSNLNIIKKTEILADVKAKHDKNDSLDVNEESLHDTPSTVQPQRYSTSTPIIDSIPNSPASSSDTNSDHKMKKILFSFLNTILSNRDFPTFQKKITEQQDFEKFRKICYRTMDINTIKKSIENGSIHSIVELRRDLMLICQNAFMFYEKNSSQFELAKELMADIINYGSLEYSSEKDGKKDEKTTGNISKSLRGSRKSQRFP